MNQAKQNQLKAIIRNLSNKWFNINLYPSQEEIALSVLDRDIRKVTITAVTRYGKSYTLALCSILFAILYDKVRIGIIAPSNDKTEPVMNYIREILASNPIMENIVDIETTGISKLEKLKATVSKKRITFKNGSSIEIKTASVKGGKGQTLMGFGYDLTLIDESAEFSSEAYTKAIRMLLESPNSKIVELGNPWHLNHFFDHHNSSSWYKIKISGDMALKEGRFDKETVKLVLEDIKTDYDRKVLWESDFPEDMAMGVFTQKNHLSKATTIKALPKDYIIKVGIDVAKGGSDYTIATVLYEYDANLYFVEYLKLDLRDQMQIVGVLREKLLDKYPKDKMHINVDTTGGLGAGIHFRLKELKYKSYEYISGNKATKNAYYNRKAEDVFGLADIMYDNRFWNLPKDSEYIMELRKWLYEVPSDKQKRIIDPADKSPDYADSLMMASARNMGRLQAFDLKTI